MEMTQYIQNNKVAFMKSLIEKSKNDDADFSAVTVDRKVYFIYSDNLYKIVLGEDYNFIFNKKNGNFSRWGKDLDYDPDYSPIGPEILDLEITTKCNGVNGKLCPFCYKSNTPDGKNMSLKTFKAIMGKMGKQLTQVAFGVDSQASSNEELWDMASHCREIGVIPNITVADVSDEVADNLVKVMGAVAVSRYDNKNVCYNSIEKLTDRIGSEKITVRRRKKKE